MGTDENQSDVARVLKQIEDEYVSARSGLVGLAVTARHSFITTRMENLGKLHTELMELVGEEAMGLIAIHLDSVPNT